METPVTAVEDRAARGALVARLGAACVAAAISSGVLKGAWELARPILDSPEAFAAASDGRRWVYGALEVLKSAGFMAGLLALFLAGTKRGPAVKAVLAVAAAGAAFFAVVWLVMAATGRFTIVYVLGGMWYQMVAPVALGAAALGARRLPRWVAIYAIAVGVANAQIFPLLGPGWALVVQGVIWAVLGYAIARTGDRARRELSNPQGWP